MFVRQRPQYLRQVVVFCLVGGYEIRSNKKKLKTGFYVNRQNGTRQNWRVLYEKRLIKKVPNISLPNELAFKPDVFWANVLVVCVRK